MAKVSIEFPETALFSMSQTVRIQDVNYRKHLSHDKLVSMIHEARAAFFESLGVSELMDSPQGYIIADLQILYLDEAFYGEELKFEIALPDISSRSCQIVYQVSKRSAETKDVLMIAKAKTGVVFYDYEARKAIPLPTALAALK